MLLLFETSSMQFAGYFLGNITICKALDTAPTKNFLQCNAVVITTVTT